MTKQQKFDRFYMKFAVDAANFSYCVRKKVGAVFVKEDITVIGYNGTMPGFANNCEDEHGETLPDVLHAESNMLGKIMNSTLVSTGGTVYCTLSPCLNCAKMMIQAKIGRFVYIRDHSDQTGLELMRKAGIMVEKYIYELD
jgi:dCMP deaminase